MRAVRSLALLLAGLGLASLVQAQPACVPTQTTEPRIDLAWTPPTPPPEGVTLTAYRLQRLGDAPAILPPVAPETLTLRDTVLPGAHQWQMQVQYRREADGAVLLSDLAPMGTPPPCVVVHSTTPPPPVLLTVVPTTTMSGEAGLHVRWSLEGHDRPVRIERRSDPALPWGHVGSAPGGFWFDLFALEPGQTYCYQVCLLYTETPVCSEARCSLFPLVQ